MKVLKIIVGIISTVFSVIILFQSCAAGFGNAIAGNGETSGSSGVALTICLLIAGIISIATGTSRGGSIVAAGFYLIGGLFGITDYGSFADLMIWAIMCFVFCALMIVAAIGARKKQVPQPAQAAHPVAENTEEESK